MKKSKPSQSLLEVIEDNLYDKIPEENLTRFTRSDFAGLIGELVVRINELQTKIYYLESGKADKQYRNEW